MIQVPFQWGPEHRLCVEPLLQPRAHYAVLRFGAVLFGGEVERKGMIL